MSINFSAAALDPFDILLALFSDIWSNASFVACSRWFTCRDTSSRIARYFDFIRPSENRGRRRWYWLAFRAVLWRNTVNSESRCALIKTRSSIERTIGSKNWIKQLHTLPVLQFNRCLTTEYSETTAHFNGNFDTDNQIYVP
jgi:hypothetical protein